MTKLSVKFTTIEQEAYEHLYDCGIKRWMVDLKDKTVTAYHNNQIKTFPSIIAFAKLHGFQQDCQS